MKATIELIQEAIVRHEHNVSTLTTGILTDDLATAASQALAGRIVLDVIHPLKVVLVIIELLTSAQSTPRSNYLTDFEQRLHTHISLTLRRLGVV